LDNCPLWRQDYDDEPAMPDYYGQTRALAEDLGGTLIDLAGGCVGVVQELGDGRIKVTALSPDDGCETIATWTEGPDGEQESEPIVSEFTPYGSK
jgi:hypothetical protein